MVLIRVLQDVLLGLSAAQSLAYRDPDEADKAIAAMQEAALNHAGADREAFSRVAVVNAIANSLQVAADLGREDRS